MKKLLLTFILFFVISGNFINADDGDFTQTEVIPDVTSYRLFEVRFYVMDSRCVVQYAKIDSNGDTLKNRVTVVFAGTEFTQLVTAINNGSNIRITIRNACKIKLGL